MSSETPSNPPIGPNEYLNQIKHEVGIAYTVYTWDDENMTKQRTAWSSLGSYYLNSYTVDDTTKYDIVLTSNQNQLLKTIGSSGIGVVDNTLGLIANIEGNEFNNVAPIIIYANGKYLAGIDDVNINNGNGTHTKLNTIDTHTFMTRDLITGYGSYSHTYTDMWGSGHKVMYDQVASGNTSVNSNDNQWTTTGYWAKGDIEENVYLPLVGESGGINRIQNKGFVYNGMTYDRPYSTAKTWRNIWNWVQNWQYGSNGMSVTNYDTSAMTFNTVDTENSRVTQITDADVVMLGTYEQELKQLYSNISSIASIEGSINDDDKNKIRTNYSDAITKISNIKTYIENSLLFNNTDHPVPKSAVDKSVITSTVDMLNIWSNVSNIESIFVSQTSAIIVKRLPWNSTFIDINNGTTTELVAINSITSSWNTLKFPTSDETFIKIMDNATITGSEDWGKAGDDGQYYSKILNRYPINYAADAGATPTFDNDLTVTNNSNGDSIDLKLSGDTNAINLGTKAQPTSWSYHISDENNIYNSATSFRFIGLKSNNDKYSNTTGSNKLEITGFNKILLEDLYENPNNYQIPSVEWKWGDGGDDQKTSDIRQIPVTSGVSYSLNIYSALHSDCNFLVAGVGQMNGSNTIGYNGVFYIPLPKEIEQSENATYQDTHWMLTTYTPNVNDYATDPGLWNSQKVLYKYTKMNNLITTGVFGGFSPYTSYSKLTAGIVNIPQVSWSSAGKTDNWNNILVSAAEDTYAKISKLISDIAYIVPLTTSSDTEINKSVTSFKAQITSASNKCTIITLNTYEADVIKNEQYMSSTRNAMYLNLFGYDDHEFNNLSFNVDRKYIFTFNCHIQATNLNLVADQVDYGRPSLLLVGHFRQRYCKGAIKNADSTQIYPGETKLIPLLNKPLENPVNNIYNIEGTYTLSWNTTGDSTIKPILQDYTFYIPEENRKMFKADKDNFADIYGSIFNTNYKGEKKSETVTVTPRGGGADTAAAVGILSPLDGDETPEGWTTYSKTNLKDNAIQFSNVLDRIYAFILVGEHCNPNIKYQFVNNTTWQSDTNKILSKEDINLFAGVNVGTSLTTDWGTDNMGIDSGILGVNEPMFSMVIQRY